MMSRWSAGLALIVALGACHRQPPERVGVTQVVDAIEQPLPVGSIATAVLAPPVPTPLPDLDVESLRKELNCARARRSCRVLRAFVEATRGIAQVPSGQGRWVGRGYRVEAGRETSDVFVLSASNVPASSVGATDLPIRVAMDSLPRDARRDGDKLSRALVRSEQVSVKNKALPLVKSWSSANGRIAMPTSGPSVRLLAEEATYVRQAGQKVIVIRLRKPQPGVVLPAADGTYAELWQVSW